MQEVFVHNSRITSLLELEGMLVSSSADHFLSFYETHLNKRKQILDLHKKIQKTIKIGGELYVLAGKVYRCSNMELAPLCHHPSCGLDYSQQTQQFAVSSKNKIRIFDAQFHPVSEIPVDQEFEFIFYDPGTLIALKNKTLILQKIN